MQALGSRAIGLLGVIVLICFVMPWATIGPVQDAIGIELSQGVLLGDGLVGRYPALYLIPLAGVAMLLAGSKLWNQGDPRFAIAGLIAASLAVTVCFLYRIDLPLAVAAVEADPPHLLTWKFGFWLTIATGLTGFLAAVFSLADRRGIVEEAGTVLSTRRIVTTGMLASIAILLGATRLGAIPVPNLSGDATILHIPVILAAVLEGPVAGVLVGAIFGVFSFLQTSPVPFFKDPLVSIVPRLFIGVTAYYAYVALRGNQYAGLITAAIVGTLTNTVLVVGAILWRFGEVFAGNVGPFLLSLVPQVIAEVVVAVVITVAVITAWRPEITGFATRRRGSSV